MRTVGPKRHRQHRWVRVITVPVREAHAVALMEQRERQREWHMPDDGTAADDRIVCIDCERQLTPDDEPGRCEAKPRERRDPRRTNGRR